MYLAFVDGEIGLLEFDLEQILAPGEMERAGLNGRRSRCWRMLAI